MIVVLMCQGSTQHQGVLEEVFAHHGEEHGEIDASIRHILIIEAT